MNESKRTGVFVAIALVLSAITFLTMPSTGQLSPASMVGKPLFPEFQDPLTATSLEVVKFEKETATASTFKVAKVGDSWVIPSHSNYPADAKDQLADVAAEWIDLEVLGVATDPGESGIQSDDIRGLHKLYGVVDPVGEDTSDVDGVGTRVVMRDKSDGELVRLIVGKEVEGQAGLHYVRLVGQDPVYTVKANTSKLSTKFQDWIEDDLLKLSSWDIRKINIEDYSIDILQGVMTPRGQMALDYNDTAEPRWKFVVDREYTEKGWTDRGLAENEELNSETLNNLKSALDDLKIVDVVRKPKGLSETLKGSGPMKLDGEAKSSLSRAGFHVVQISDPANPGQSYPDLRSNEGEISVAMKDGVNYVLRFGQIASMGAGDDEKKEAPKGEEPDKESANSDGPDDAKKGDSSDSKVNRYLFVMAELDPSTIEQPKYEELPELPSEQAKPEEAASEDEKKEEIADAKSEEVKPESKPEESKADEAKPEVAKAEEAKPEEAKPDEAKPDEAKAEGEKVEAAGADKASDDKAEGNKVEKAEEKKPEEPKPTREEIQKKRDEIQKENDRKKAEYEESIKKSDEKVKELNARFADWYYIIDDAEYQKIHLGRDKIVKAKEKKAEEKQPADGSVPAAPAVPGMEPDSVGEFQNLKLDAPAQGKD